MRRPCTFRQRDVRAAIKAARDAGVQVARVEVGTDGKITLLLGEAEPDTKRGNELDDWITKHAR
jgi:hypothetical protein